MAKVMVVIRDENFRLLSLEARDRGITIQELIRAVIVPDWFRNSSGISRARVESSVQPTSLPRGENEIPIFNRSRP